MMEHLRRNWLVISKVTWGNWLKHSKVSENLTLMGLFWAKYIVWDKKVEKVFFMTLRSDAKFEEKLTYVLENDRRNSAVFHQSTQKSHNWDFDGIFFIQSRKWVNLKFTEELCVMAIKNDVTFGDELTCCFKIGRMNLTNFDPNTWKSQKFAP